MVLYARITPILAAIAVCLLLLQCAMEPMPDAATHLSLDTLPDTCKAPTYYPDPRPPRP